MSSGTPVLSFLVDDLQPPPLPGSQSPRLGRAGRPPPSPKPVTPHTFYGPPSASPPSYAQRARQDRLRRGSEGEQGKNGTEGDTVDTHDPVFELALGVPAQLGASDAYPSASVARSLELQRTCGTKEGAFEQWVGTCNAVDDAREHHSGGDYADALRKSLSESLSSPLKALEGEKCASPTVAAAVERRQSFGTRSTSFATGACAAHAGASGKGTGQLRASVADSVLSHERPKSSMPPSLAGSHDESLAELRANMRAAEAGGAAAARAQVGRPRGGHHPPPKVFQSNGLLNLDRSTSPTGMRLSGIMKPRETRNAAAPPQSTKPGTTTTTTRNAPTQSKLPGHATRTTTTTRGPASPTKRTPSKSPRAGALPTAALSRGSSKQSTPRKPGGATTADRTARSATNGKPAAHKPSPTTHVSPSYDAHAAAATPPFHGAHDGTSAALSPVQPTCARQLSLAASLSSGSSGTAAVNGSAPANGAHRTSSPHAAHLGHSASPAPLPAADLEQLESAGMRPLQPPPGPALDVSPRATADLLPPPPAPSASPQDAPLYANANGGGNESGAMTLSELVPAPPPAPAPVLAEGDVRATWDAACHVATTLSEVSDDDTYVSDLITPRARFARSRRARQTAIIRAAIGFAGGAVLVVASGLWSAAPWWGQQAKSPVRIAIEAAEAERRAQRARRPRWMSILP